MTVFVLTDSENLVPMSAAQFAAEDDFQRLLAKFPELLSGDQDATGAARRWLLIKREKSIPSEEGGSARWSIDHLFLDQDGIPTLVEVKRQSDTRIRREVVGQMLDYAANAVVYWPIEQLKMEFAERCGAEDANPDDLIQERLGVEASVLWQSVKENLERGHIRMLFVADNVPTELRRIVEFLNKQMSPAEVLALELRQFAGQGLKTIVPVMFGRTEEAQQKKSAQAARDWNRDTILTEIAKRQPEQGNKAKRIADWIEKNSDTVWYGKGSQDASMATVVKLNGQNFYPIYLYTYGKIQITFQLNKKPLFSDEGKQRELLQRLNEIGEIRLPPDSLTRQPAIALSDLRNEQDLNQFLGALDWMIGELRSNQ